MDMRNQSLADSLVEAEAAYAAANPESARLGHRGEASMPGGNTRTTLFFAPFPLVIASAEDGWLVDVDGHRYADFVNEYSAGMYGHSSGPIREAVTAAMAHGINFGGPNRYEADLAEKLIARFPSLELVRFCNSGTEANMLALGTARAVTGRDKVLVFDGAYHGSLFYFHHGASPLNAPIPVVMAEYNDLADAVRVLDENRGEIAAVILEPMQGSAGCLAGDRAFLEGLRAACSERDVVLIFDEVMTSRLSSGGLQKKLGVTPDMTTLGKYIGGGITLAAFGGRADLMARFDPRSKDALPHGGTFNNNVLAMAAGCTAFDKLLTEEALDRMNGYGDRLRDRLNAYAGDKGLPVTVTGVGSLVGTHFQEGPIRRDADTRRGPAHAAFADTASRLLHYHLLERGHYAARRGYMALSLATTAAQIDALGDAVEEFLDLRGLALIEEYAAAAG